MKTYTALNGMRVSRRDVTGIRRVFGIACVALAAMVNVRDSRAGIVSVPGVAVNASSPTMDGQISVAQEYAGAAEMAMTYYTDPGNPGTYVSIPEYLIHDDDNLYVAIRAVRSGHYTDPLLFDQSHVSVFVDPGLLRGTDAGPSHLQLQVDVGSGTVRWLAGDGTGGFQPMVPPPADQWQVASMTCGDDVNWSRCVEVRLSKTLLGDWSGRDGLAIGHCSGNWCGGVYMTPSEASDQPYTWATLTYGSAVTLPHIQVSGWVMDTWYEEMNQPIAIPDTDVYVLIGDSVQRTTTDANGHFAASVVVPPNTPVTVQCGSNANWRWLPSRTGPGIAPIDTSVNDRVAFPGCAGGTCVYASIIFRPRVPPGTAVIERVDPDSVVRPTLLSDPNVITCSVPGYDGQLGTMRLWGQNLHEGIYEANLSTGNPYSDATCVVDRPGDVCDGMDQWTLFPATILGRDPDRNWIDVTVPMVPANAIVKGWWWVLKQNWTAQREIVYPRFDKAPSDPARGSLTFSRPNDYPDLYAFGFVNPPASSSSFEEFLACYGPSAYCCVGVLDACLFYVPDPLYWIVMWPIYDAYINHNPFSCVGMSATSLLMNRGNLQISSFAPQARYPAGVFQCPDEESGNWHAPIGGIVFGPPTPANLYGMIRMNHGVQTSMEALSCAIHYSLMSSRDVCDEVMKYPFGRALSMTDVGHTILPYRIDGNRLFAYDSNIPPNLLTQRGCRYRDEYSVVLDRDAGTYYADGHGSGRVMIPLPLSLWENRRTAPGILNADQLFSFICGSGSGVVDVLYTTSGGRQWGYLPDGTFVDNMPGLVPLPPMGASGAWPHNIPVALPMSGEAPCIVVRANSSKYLAHAANNGVFLQLEAPEMLTSTDKVTLEYDGDHQLAGVRLFRENGSGGIIPRIGMVLGDRARALFRWRGLCTEEGSTMEFTARKDSKGVSYRNDSGAVTTHTLDLDVVDGESGSVGRYTFGPFDVPGGATQTLSVVDWPTGATLVSELDVDSNGAAEAVQLYSGARDCTVTERLDPDCNHNGISDYCERNAATDSNNNGLLDACEPGDLDGDGVGNAKDNCPGQANADQEDSDGDSVGDACKALKDLAPGEAEDSDGDGVANNLDQCPDTPVNTAVDEVGCPACGTCGAGAVPGGLLGALLCAGTKHMFRRRESDRLRFRS